MTLRTWMRSRPMSSIRLATAGVIRSFSATMTSSVTGFTMLWRLTRPTNRGREFDFHLFTAVDNALGDALGGTAVVLRDDDVLAPRRPAYASGNLSRPS